MFSNHDLITISLSLVVGVLATIVTNLWTDHRDKNARKKQAKDAIHQYILSLDSYSDWLWALVESHAGDEGYPDYRPDQFLLSKSDKDGLSTSFENAKRYFHMLSFTNEAEKRKALENSIPYSFKGSPFDDAEICDERIKLLKNALSNGLNLKAKV